jgi:hypothetical protein
MLNILLFDMDDVLLEAHGYHRALQDTVSFIGTSLGFEKVNLKPEDIAAFEASGVTSEWDSSAVCMALMFDKIWSVDPGRQLSTSPSAKPVAPIGIEPPDFNKLATAMGDPSLKSLYPRERAERLMIGGDYHRSESQKRMISEILHNARHINRSITHRVFQELILGSNEFNRSYQLKPYFKTESYLSKFDQPTLSHEDNYRLNKWLQQPGHSGVIMTNRPSRAPDGFFCTHEAEIGAKLVGLEILPIAGYGGLSWLSQIREQGLEAYIKPSPLHALTALRLAIGDTLKQALHTTAYFALENQVDESWKQLEFAQVAVFEDTPSGIESLIRAKKYLESVGIQINIQLFGISTNYTKRISLQRSEASLYHSLSSALHASGILP